MTSVTKVTLFVLDPLWDSLTTPEQIQSLHGAGYELRVDASPKPLKDVPGLFAGDQPRALVINPDYIGWKLQDEDYANIPNLCGIFIASTSFHWLEQGAANKRNVPICNITNFSTQSVAEWAVMVAFLLARQVPRLIKDGFPLDYNDDFMKYRGIELKGKTAGIIGLGNIGSAIAERCQGLGMKVVYWSRSPKDTPYESLGLSEVLKTADVLFPTLAKNAETRELLSGDVAKQIKQGAICVDIAELLDHQQMLDMVTAGKLRGFGFEGKPAEFANYEGNVWAAPAYAWATAESMRGSAAKVIDNLLAASKGNYPNKVNK